MFSRTSTFRLCSVLLVVISLLIVPAGQAIAAHLDTKTQTPSGPVRGVRDDLWADIVLGKPDFGSLSPGEVTGSRVFNPGGVIIDRSVSPNRMYVHDGGNSRVLGLHVNDQSGRRAELVLGQPGLDGYSGCNRDNNFQNYPQRAAANASTLCGMAEDQVSPREGGSFANMAVDANGNLYVPDFYNSRVLLYNSPFETDTIADDVWGQADFSGKTCNRGHGQNYPDAFSLCFPSTYTPIYGVGFVGGVGLDSANNLWVADNQNNRVLRFPYDPKTRRPGHVANLVLGQPDFVTASHGKAMNQMLAPAAVRVSAAGRVYVADSLNNRILIFNPPFSNGMAASGTLGSGLHLPTSIEFDQSGNIWVSDSANNQLLRFTPAGIVDRVLFKDLPSYNGRCGSGAAPDGPAFYFPGPDVYQDPVNLCDSRGSIGIDSDGNIWVTGSSFLQDVRRYPAPFPVPTAGVAHAADVQVFQPYAPGQANAVTERGLLDPRGVTRWGDQLIVADSGRLLFWNHAPDALVNGQAADGVVIAPNFNTVIDPPLGKVRVDGQDRLWVSQGNRISVYHLPLVTGDQPFYILEPPVAVRTNIIWDSNLDIAGMVISDDGDYLWLSDPTNHRVFRIAAPLTNPVVDVVLGQLNANGNSCNQGRGPNFPAANSLCFPGELAMDKNGNLYVSDFALENRGNFRLLEYNAKLFPASPTSALFGISASRVYGTNGKFGLSGCFFPNGDPLCKPLEPAFDQTGKMVVGLSAYTTGYTGQNFVLVYQDPFVNPFPVNKLKDYYTMPSAAYYDSDDNLYIADRNRNRLLIYLASPHIISGNVGVPGVILSYTDGIAKTVKSTGQGKYWARVSDNWSGVITPSKDGVTFTPASRSYTNVLADQTGQDYIPKFNTHTITFRSIGAQDGWVRETTETSNRGGALDSSATTFRLGDDESKKQYRSILSFMTSGLPDTAMITNVTFKVKKESITGGGNPLNLFGGFMVDLRNGFFSTPELQGVDFSLPASETYGPFSPDLSNEWYNISLTNGKTYINKLAANSGLTQIRLGFELDDNNNAVANYLSLYSGNATAANRPQLVITYYVP